MGTITTRKSKDGPRYTGQIRIKRGGIVIHTESWTNGSHAKVTSWLKKRETELEVPGAIDKLKAPKMTLAQAIDRYVAESVQPMGKTKLQCLATIKTFEIADMECSGITSVDLVEFGHQLCEGRGASTVGNYFSHLSKIFELAKPAWGYPLDLQAYKGARAVLLDQGRIADSEERDRRPTLAELNLIMNYFIERMERAPWSMPMHRIVAFAIYSTRRQEEITRLRWEDFDEEGGRVLVRDMKDPRKKKGNHTWCELVPEAVAIVKAMPSTSEFIFPYNPGTISDNFMDARRYLGIDEELKFHNLRHEGVSRLFEMGRSIAQVASVSGHKSWSSLKRYTHLRQTGDKYTGWRWLPVVTASMEPYVPSKAAAT